VVLAAGADVGVLCKPLGVTLPVAASPACLMQVAAPPGLVRTTLAPTVGRLVANELVSGEPVAELRRCRPQRFATERTV
jgi:glycine/D-amino acid oxidase-like deaminating enzyme